MDIKQFYDEAISVIAEMRKTARQEAAELFPDHPKAQDVWVKLCSMDGGIASAVEVLGLQSEYEQYRQDLQKDFENGASEIIAIKVNGFTDFCKQQVRENFYMFK